MPPDIANALRKAKIRRLTAALSGGKVKIASRKEEGAAGLLSGIALIAAGMRNKSRAIKYLSAGTGTGVAGYGLGLMTGKVGKKPRRGV